MNKENKEYETFADFFLEARHELGLSQMEMADLLGISPNTVHRWEHNTDSPPIKTAQYVCKRLGGTIRIIKIKREGAD